MRIEEPQLRGERGLVSQVQKRRGKGEPLLHLSESPTPFFWLDKPIGPYRVLLGRNGCIDSGCLRIGGESASNWFCELNTLLNTIEILCIACVPLVFFG